MRSLRPFTNGLHIESTTCVGLNGILAMSIFGKAVEEKNQEGARNSLLTEPLRESTVIRTFPSGHGMPTQYLFLVIQVLGLLLWLPCLSKSGEIHAASPITPSGGLNTQVNLSMSPPAGHTQYDITGGTRPGGATGTNLFHSFGDFNVPTNNIANFLNSGSVDLNGTLLPPNLPTSNILGRVTGVDPSIIFGTIQTNGTVGFGNANLFLMNPYGFLFGPNATVNAGGMVAFTTADYLRLSDGVLFNKMPNVAQDALLSAAPMTAFGFLGSNPAAITIQGSTLQVAQDQSLSFVGGNQGFTYMNPDTGNIGSVPAGVTITGSKLSAPGGQINLASVASAGEVLFANLQLGANVNGQSFTSLGGITVSQDARIDTSGTTGGIITIRGGQLTIRDGPMITSAASSGSSAPPASVTINGAGVQLTGSDLVIIGTDVSVTGSKLIASNLDGSGGTIAITAGSADHPGNVALAQNVLLDASGTSGGSITIRGGQLAIADGTLSADTSNFKGAVTGIDINVTANVTISDTRGAPAITARATGTGDAGEIKITSGSLDASTTNPQAFRLLDSHTSGTGHAGSVSISTGDLTVSGAGSTIFRFIDSGFAGPGHGGDVTVTGKNISLNETTISTGDFVANSLGQDSSGSAGNLQITADSLRLTNAYVDTGATAGGLDTQQAGDITLNVRAIDMNNSQVFLIGNARGGNITIKADRFFADFTHFETDTVFGPGGGITVTAPVVELTNGSSLISSTFGDGKAGDIRIMASDHVNLLGVTGQNPLGVFRPSGIFSNSFAFVGTRGGDAGDIVVTTPRLEMTQGRINTSTETGGHGGNVIVNAGTILIAGEFPNPDFLPEQIFTITDIHPSGIFTKTVGKDFCGGSCGDAGRISIAIGSLTMGDGSQIDSGTSSTGGGGAITIHATNSISMSGTLSDGSPVGIFSRTIGTTPDTGSGGNIALTAGQSVTISNGASVSASSTGPGNTGDIQINAGNLFEMTNSSVTTEANHSSGGAIKITTNPSGTMQITDSLISASVLDGEGGGGSLYIDPLYLLLQNSRFLAQAVRGPGGNITINITNGGLFLTDANSVISASSQFGVNGTVTIQSPNAPTSGQIQPLGKSPLIATSLFNQRCAALSGGEFSSFTLAGRDSLPIEPGSWLASPLATLSAGTGLGVKAEGERPLTRGEGPEGTTLGTSSDGETPLLSLRQIAPAGFLTQAFAMDGSASCQS